ncbi:MAG: hypothetical protein ACKO40_13865 [Planctomycetaceae bacterium]
MLRVACLVIVLAAPAMADEPQGGDAPPARLGVRQFPDAAVVDGPPSARELVDARAEFEARYPGVLARGRTSAGAFVLADALIDEAAAEGDRGVKWLMLAEARRMAVASGNAAAVERAIVQASATYEFDAIDEELRSLKEIPVRLLAPERAAAFAEVAERLAARSESDARIGEAATALELAVRGWQRAGHVPAARKAAARYQEITASR